MMNRFAVMFYVLTFALSAISSTPLYDSDDHSSLFMTHKADMIQERVVELWRNGTISDQQILQLMLSNDPEAKQYKKSDQQVHQENLQHIKNFVAYDVDQYSRYDHNNITDREKRKVITRGEANQILQAASSNIVVSLWNTSKYDPDNEGIGYCFGRAMFTHIELRYRGIDPNSVKKAFAVGTMTTGGGSRWGWHVTTIVQSEEYGQEVWLAIDPIIGKIVTLTEWYNIMENDYSIEEPLKLYITSPGRFTPSSNEDYTREQISHPGYYNYFKDMMDWFGNQYSSGGYTNIQL
jgi:hypothetical protein